MTFVEKGSAAYEAGIRANMIRQRLTRPPNAVKDEGIDLRRGNPSQLKPLVFVSQTKVTKLEDDEALSHPPLPFKTLPNILTPAEILHAVTEYYGVTIEDIKGDCRKVSKVYPRHMAIYMVRTRTKKSWGEMKPFFGKRDHTTLLHGLKRITLAVKWSNQHVINDIFNIMDRINDCRSRFGLPTIDERFVALELDNKKSLSGPEICELAEGCSPPLVGPEAEGVPDNPR